MRAAHLLRKVDPAEWSGTEMAVHRLLEGLRQHGVDPIVYCPRIPLTGSPDPFERSGFKVERFRAFVPVFGLSAERKRQLIAVGGNLMSFDLLPTLWREKDLAVVHAHTMGRIGGIGLTIAKTRRLPYVITIHGGLLDLPENVKRSFNAPHEEGFEWGKLFGIIFQSHRLLRDADAIVTCNAKEAALLQAQFPGKRIHVQPHGVPVELYRERHVAAAQSAFPSIVGRDVLLCLGRIDPVKNQEWLLKQAPRLLARHPRAMLVFAGPCTDEVYGRKIAEMAARSGLRDRLLFTGGLPPNDPRLIGLLQASTVLIIPSLSETFGLVILEAWAARTMVVSVRASGPAALIEDGRNGWFFDLDKPETLDAALDNVLRDPSRRAEMVARGAEVADRYSVNALAKQLKELYQDVIEEKQCVT